MIPQLDGLFVALLLGAFLLAFSTTAEAKPVRTPVEYQVDGVKYEGVLLHDGAVKTPRPGLLLVPNWLGINEANLEQAERVAGSGYVVFVVDMFGKGRQPKSREDAPKRVEPLKADRPRMRALAGAALQAFKKVAPEANVDAAKLGAVGFCFGGTTVIELAKAGAELAGVVSFHGGLDAKLPTGSKPKASVLALHGAEDPSVPPADLEAFKNDLRRVGADWMLVEFGGAVHSFTDLHANTPGRAMYDAKTAARAYELMRDFFRERFGSR